MSCQTNSIDGHIYDDEDGQQCNQLIQEDANVGANVTVYGGIDAAGQEVNDALLDFAFGGPQLIVYNNDDPFTMSFKASLGMQAIAAGITQDCSLTSAPLSVGTLEAFINTMIDGPYQMDAGGKTDFSYSPEAQMGGFNASYSRSGGMVNITITNPIHLDSLAYHMTKPLGIQDPKSAPLGTINQQLNITAKDPCQ